MMLLETTGNYYNPVKEQQTVASLAEHLSKPVVCMNSENAVFSLGLMHLVLCASIFHRRLYTKGLSFPFLTTVYWTQWLNFILT